MATQAPSAPAPAAPAPAPAPAAPPASSAPAAPPAAAAPSTSGADRSPDSILEDLRSEVIAWGHEGNKPASSEAAPAVPAAPEQTAEGSTPPSDSQPAPSAPTSSAHENWVKRYGDPEKAASEAFALEQRAAEMARELKALKGEHPPTVQPSAPTATAPAPEQVAAPAASPSTPQPAPAHPAPAPTEGQPASIEAQALDYAMNQDEKCRELIEQFNTTKTDLEKLTKTDIPALREEIRKSQTLIDHPSVDELVKDEARHNLQRAEMTLAAREAKAAELRLTSKELGHDFRTRVDGFASRLHEQVAVRTREAEAEQFADRQASEFVEHWPKTFEAEFKEQGIDPDMRADIHEAVKVLALARPGRIELKDLGSFMKEAIKAEFVKMDKYHRNQARAYALRKNADTSPAAPTGPAATATEVPANVSTDDILNALKNETRAQIRARRGA